MPRHMRTSVYVVRWTVLALAALVLAAIVFGVWWFVSKSTTSESGDTPASLSSSAGMQASTNSASAAASTTTVTPASTPTPTVTPIATSTLTAKAGRASTLDGLVPDYVLPPIENGMVPVLTKIPTEQKVVFLTIDDGAIKRESDLKLLESSGVKASLFLAHSFIAGQADFYKSYTDAGHLIEDHTMTHNLDFIHLSYAEVKAEICGMADFEEAQYGRRPVFFRPPGGPYTNAIRQAVAECGMKAVVDWEAKANGGGMDYQVGASLRPGDIVLMHFRPEFPADLKAFLTAQKAAGLKVVLLEDYLGVG